jgi:asparagine synthase (glutamine-hydrolysing)
MCGIAGVVDSQGTVPVTAGLVHQMCATIVHRGPDEEGVYAKGGVGLGIRRLSIIDVSGGQQPVHNEDHTVGVVFNGEIYNFKQLRSELQSSGHHFYSNTDTEVIVHLYEEYGADCVLKLRSMFAFALFDERTRVLLLARDRLGKKPLYYALKNGCLIFGSEIKAILAADPSLTESINREALLDYFHFGYIPHDLTAFTAIHKLPAGH